MDKNLIIQGLKEYDDIQVKQFANYCYFLANEKHKKGDKKGEYKNAWMGYKKPECLIDCFKRVNAEGLVFDGKDITLQSIGISYNYHAYRNKMILVYPESIIDIDLVYKDDVFSFGKKSGKVDYSHDLSDPFSREDKNIIGAYCVIKNKRGEFLTTLTKDELEKHRKIANTDTFWTKWYVEMCKKTVMKKGCSQHFKDIYQNIIETDNDNYDINNDLSIELSVKQEIEAIETTEKLEIYYFDNVDKHKSNKDGFNKMIMKQKEKLMAENEDN